MGYSNIGTADQQRWVEVTSEDLRDLQGVTDHVEYQKVLRRNHKHDQTITTKGNTTMATAKKNTPVEVNPVNDVLAALVDALMAYLGVEEPAAKAPGKSPTKPTKVVEPDEDEEGEDEVAAFKATMEKKTLAALKKEAISRGYLKEDVADATKEDLIESIVDDEFNQSEDADDEDEEDGDLDPDEADEDEDEDADDEDEEDEDESDEGYSEEDLQPLTLTALKKIAVEAGYAMADLKGYDKEEVIALILEESDEDAEDEEEDEDELDEDTLNDMSLAEVKAVAKENGVRIKPGMKKAQIIEAILA